jgi:glycine/D-amino acid oxidase-like deaminating enzyme
VPQDGLPVVGAVAEGVYVAVLHSGITLGPIIAELIAKDIAGRLDNADAAMIAPYRPQRFAKG